MKKLLFALGAMSLTAVASTSVIACSSDSKVGINGLAIADQTAVADTTKKNSDLATNATILAAIDAAFKASKDDTIKAAVLNTDYTVTAESPDAAQAAETTVILDVKGKGKLTGITKVNVALTATFIG